MSKGHITETLNATNSPRAKPAIKCTGDCDGAGWIAVYLHRGDTMRGHDDVRPVDEDDEELMALWEAAQAKDPSIDGWHFVVCPDCKGSGLNLEAVDHG